jgi:TonB family protein
MYEAMRTRAPFSTRITGASTMVLAMAAVSYALANGIGVRVMPPLDPPTFISSLPLENTKTETVEDTDLPIDVDAPAPRELTTVLDDFVVKPPPQVITGKRDTGLPPETGLPPPPRAPKRIAPDLLEKATAPYPPASIRAGEIGTTKMEVCVDARGRVTSAIVASSSGHERLDAAAVRWVRQARFAAGTVDGQPQAMCGHKVVNEWTLESVK